MQQMLDVASSYAAEVGLQFSTDPDPVKSKSKAVFMVGRERNLAKPATVFLSGKALPYVPHATHLGHEFHESGTMEMDTRMRRGAYIGRSLEVQEAFSFAAPAETLEAVKLYCCDLYGGMLADLGGQPATQLMNCWGTTVKDVWRVPRPTHRVYARWLGSGFSSIRQDLLSRWVKFYQSLVAGPSPEVATIARVAAGDMRTTTAKNNRLIYDLTGLDARVATAAQVRMELRRRKPALTDVESRTAGLIGLALQVRQAMYMEGLSTDDITTEIDNMCVR